MAEESYTYKDLRTKGDPIRVIDIKTTDPTTFNKIRRGGRNSRGKKYLAVIYEIEGEQYEK